VAAIAASTLAIASACAAPGTGAARCPRRAARPRRRRRRWCRPAAGARARRPDGHRRIGRRRDRRQSRSASPRPSPRAPGRRTFRGSPTWTATATSHAGADGTRVVVLTRTDAKLKRRPPDLRTRAGHSVASATRTAGGGSTRRRGRMPPHLPAEGRTGPSDAQAARARPGSAVRDEGAGRHNNQRTQGHHRCPPSFAGTSPELARTRARSRTSDRRSGLHPPTTGPSVGGDAGHVRDRRHPAPAWSPDGSRIAFSTAHDVDR